MSDVTRKMQKYLNNDLPRIVGNLAVNHFKDNFRKGGFVDNGVKKWEDPKRFNANGKTAGEKYGTLQSSTNELMNSISFSVSGDSVSITSDKAYAAIHNEGGIIDIPITDKMRGYAFYRHGEETKGEKKKPFTPWLGLAITKKQNLKVNMPQRQFVGPSAELDDEIANRIARDFDKIFKSVKK